MTNQPIRDQMDEADLIVHHAKVTTLQDNGSEADAFAEPQGFRRERPHPVRQ